MIKQLYFCDKCKEEIKEGDYIFKCKDLEIYRNIKGTEDELRLYNRYEYNRDKELYCEKCIKIFFTIPTKKELEESKRKSKHRHENILMAKKYKSIKED